MIRASRGTGYCGEMRPAISPPLRMDTGSDSVEYTDSTVAAEIAYFYAVLALSQNVDGEQSTTVSVTTQAAPEPKKEKR